MVAMRDGARCRRGVRTRLRALAAAVGLVSNLAIAANALPSGQILALAGGASFPGQNGAGDAWSTGFTLGAALMWKAAPVLALGVEVSYMRHPLDTDAYEAMIRDSYPNVSTGGRNLWALPVSVIGELDLLEWGVVKPYVRAGFGVYTFGTTDFTASGPGSDALEADVAADPVTMSLNDTVFGTLIGLGVHTPLSPSMSLTVDATYHVANTVGESTHFIPVRLGLRF